MALDKSFEVRVVFLEDHVDEFGVLLHDDAVIIVDLHSSRQEEKGYLPLDRLPGGIEPGMISEDKNSVVEVQIKPNKFGVLIIFHRELHLSNGGLQFSQHFWGHPLHAPSPSELL